MATRAVSGSPFFWKSWSYNVKYRLGLTDPRLKTLIQCVKQLSLDRLTSPDSQPCANPARELSSDLYLALSYLTAYPDPELEESLQSKFKDTSIPQEQLGRAITNMAQLCVNHKDEKMIEVCGRVIEYCPMKDITQCNINIKERIHMFQEHVPIGKISKAKPPLPSWTQKIWFVIGNVRFVPYYIYITLKKAFRFEMPTSSYTAQTQLTFYRTTYLDFLSLEDNYLKKYLSGKQILVMAALSFLSLSAFNNMYCHLQNKYPEFFNILSELFKSLVPESFDESQYRDLTADAKNGLIEPSVGKRVAQSIIEACLSPPEGSLPRAVIITGDAGVGKTNKVDDLALRITENKTACLGGKKVITVNGAKLKGKGSYKESGEQLTRFEDLMKIIEGKEDEYILFIDEAHNLDDNALQELKTLLLTKPIRIIFATTRKELKKTWIQDDALLSRCRKINIDSLENEYRHYILQKILLKFNTDPKHPIPINPNIIGKILEVIDTVRLKGSEPRRSKNFLDDLLKMLNAFSPEEPPLLGFLQQKYDEIQGTVAFEQRKNRAYILGEKFPKDKRNLDLLKKRINTLKEYHSQRLALSKQRSQFLKLTSKLDQKLEALQQRIGSASPDKLAELENQFLFYIFFAFKQINDEISRLETALRQGLSPDKLNLEELVTEKLVSQEELNKYKMSASEQFLTTITPEMIEELGKRLKEEEQTTHLIKTGQDGSSTNVAGLAGQAQPGTNAHQPSHYGAIPGDGSVSRVSSSLSTEQVPILNLRENPPQTQRRGFSYKLELLHILQQNNLLIHTILAARSSHHMGRSVSFEQGEEGLDSAHAPPLNVLPATHHPSAALTSGASPGAAPFNPKHNFAGAGPPTATGGASAPGHTLPPSAATSPTKDQ